VQKTLDLKKIGRKIASNAEINASVPKMPDCGQTLQDDDVKKCCWILKILLAICALTM